MLPPRLPQLTPKATIHNEFRWAQLSRSFVYDRWTNSGVEVLGALLPESGALQLENFPHSNLDDTTASGLRTTLSATRLLRKAVYLVYSRPPKHTFSRNTQGFLTFHQARRVLRPLFIAQLRARGWRIAALDLRLLAASGFSQLGNRFGLGL